MEWQNIYTFMGIPFLLFSTQWNTYADVLIFLINSVIVYALSKSIVLKPLFKNLDKFTKIIYIKIIILSYFAEIFFKNQQILFFFNLDVFFTE